MNSDIFETHQRFSEPNRNSQAGAQLRFADARRARKTNEPTDGLVISGGAAEADGREQAQ